MKPSSFFVLFSISILLFPAGTAAIEDPMHRTMGDDGACDLVHSDLNSVFTGELTGYQDLPGSEATFGTATKRGVPTPGPTTPAVHPVTFQGYLDTYMVRSGGVSLWIDVRHILDDPEDFLDLGDHVQVDYYFADSEPEYQIHYVIDQDIESGDAVEVFCSAFKESNLYGSTENYRLGADHYVRRIENPQFTPPVLTLKVTNTDNLSVTVDPILEPDDWTRKTLRIHWDWGDGKTDDRHFSFALYACPIDGECPYRDGLIPPVDPIKHTYPEPGTYTIKATANISGNQNAEASVTVTVGTGAGIPDGIGDGSTHSDLINRYRNRDSAYSDLIDRYRNRDPAYSDLIEGYRNHDPALGPIEPDESPDPADQILTDRNHDYESAYSNLVEQYQNRDSAYSNLVGRYHNL